MNNRIIISSIQIRNFRSIRNETIAAKNLNVFVGLNDAGKSNVLKALNLFFNGQTDYGVDFDFKKDFSYLFSKTSHRTKEIVIELRFQIPDTYKEKGVFVWRKTWRISDYFEEILNSKGEKPSDRSRVPSTLRRIKYRYVPAVKSKEYYKSLLADLYYTVSAVLDSPLEDSVKGFSEVLKNYTIKISDEVSKRIGLSSLLSIPDNLSELFRTLVFRTISDSDEGEVPLDMRGDGIQARHIPIILKYIADEDQKTRNQGSMKVSTIWGFEEPENGVELSRAFDMARDFRDYSNDIQMFITSHSPAFYTINNTDEAQVIFVDRVDGNEGTHLSASVNRKSIGISMGLMPLIAPYIAEKEKIISEAKQLIDNNGLCDVPTIFVEGKTDKCYLELAISYYAPDIEYMLKSNELRIFTQDGKGGCQKLVDWAYAWIFSGNMSKMLVLFDCDNAADVKRRELTESDIYKHKRSSAMVNVKTISPSSDIIYVKSKHINLPYEVEHLLSREFWKTLKVKNYLEERKGEELSHMTSKYASIDKSVKTIIEETIEDIELRDTIVMFNPHSEKKDKILSLLQKCKPEEQKKILEGFEPTIEMLKKIFCV